MHSDRPSRTARKVALNVLALGAREGMDDVLPSGIVDATAQLLLASEVAGPRTVRFARSKMAVGVYLAFDWMMPGQFEGFAHRKSFCERQVRKGIETGARQVLVLGAGFDTLGWRLAPEFPDVEFLEVDHPTTARFKSRGIEAMGKRPNHRLVSADLGQWRLHDVLRSTGIWNEDAVTVIVAEGLLMYLRPEEVGALLQRCAQASGVASRIAFTYVGKRHDGGPDAGPWTWLVLRLLAAGGEPWQWWVQPDQLAPFLERWGWNFDPDETVGSAGWGIEHYGVAVRAGA